MFQSQRVSHEMDRLVVKVEVFVGLGGEVPLAVAILRCAKYKRLSRTNLTGYEIADVSPAGNFIMKSTMTGCQKYKEWHMPS
jgi:hypothetical protein